MTRNNWIACAILASAAAIGACSPKGGQAGQPDRAVDQQNQASDQNTRNNNNRDNTARDVSELPVSLTIPAGTHFDLTVNSELSSRKNKPGDTFTAKIYQDVRDASGTVVIQEGSTVNGSIVAVKPAPNRRTPGTLTVALSTIETNGKTFPIRATIDSVHREYRKQDVNAGDAAKVGVGAAAGAVVGQVLSKNTKGTVIGAVVGGIAGAGVAVETKDLDIVIPDGSHILATVTEPLRIAINRDDLNDRRNDRSDTTKSKSRTY
ncbi:MAG: glycine zipper 2TM domain-containing protein [Gemmatimonadales bacterium]